MNKATSRRKTHTGSQRRPPTLPNSSGLMSPDFMEDITNVVSEKVDIQMEKRIEEIFNKMTSQENTDNSCV